MASVDYYKLLRDGIDNISAEDWATVTREVIQSQSSVLDEDGAMETLEGILTDFSAKWVEKRTRIIRGAESCHANPTLMSDYCRTSLKKLIREEAQDPDGENGENARDRVHRQVMDHLRKLRDAAVLISQMVKARKGKDLWNLWGLVSWGQGWLRRTPTVHFDNVGQKLPVISATDDGKGVFDYSKVLPEYLPNVLDVHGAPLATSQISELVADKVSPPLPKRLGRSDAEDENPGRSRNSMDSYSRTNSPEDLFLERERWQSFWGKLTKREIDVLDMKQDGLTIRAIAEKLGYSERTVNGDWKSIFQKAREALETA